MSNRDMNLLPDYYLKQRRQHRLDVVLLIFYMLVIGGVVWLTYSKGKKMDELRAVHEKEHARFVQSEKTLAEFYAAQMERNLVFDEVKRFADLTPKIPRSYLLGELVLLAPEDMGFLRIRMIRTVPKAPTPKKDEKAKGVSKTPAAPPKPLTPYVTIFLDGFAETNEDIYEFMKRLKSHPVINEKETTLNRFQTKNIGKEKYQQFDAVIHTESQMDIPKWDKKKKPVTVPETQSVIQEEVGS